MYRVQPDLLAHRVADGLPVSGEHDGFRHTLRLERTDRLRRILLRTVCQLDPAEITSVIRHMDGCICRFCRNRSGKPRRRHRFFVPGNRGFSVQYRRDPVSCRFGRFRHLCGQRTDFRCISGADGLRDRVVREGFRPCGNGEQRLFRHTRGRMEGAHRESALGQRPGLIEYGGSGVGKPLHVYAALDEYPLARRGADRTEVGQRHRDHQSARAGYNEEVQGTIEPIRERAETEHRRQDRKHHRTDHNDRGVDRGKLRDEPLRCRLGGRCVFHQLQNLRDCRVAVGLCHPDRERAAFVDGSAHDLRTHVHRPRHTFSGQRGGVHGRRAGHNHAIERDFLSRLYEDHAVHRYLIGIVVGDAAVLHHVRHVRTERHQLLQRAAGFAHRHVLKQFAELVKEHDRRRFLHLADTDRTHRGNRHEKVFIEDLPVQDVPRRFPQHLPADKEIRSHEQPGADPPKHAVFCICHPLQGKSDGEDRRPAAPIRPLLPHSMPLSCCDNDTRETFFAKKASLAPPSKAFYKWVSLSSRSAGDKLRVRLNAADLLFGSLFDRGDLILSSFDDHFGREKADGAGIHAVEGGNGPFDFCGTVRAVEVL